MTIGATQSFKMLLRTEPWNEMWSEMSSELETSM